MGARYCWHQSSINTRSGPTWRVCRGRVSHRGLPLTRHVSFGCPRRGRGRGVVPHPGAPPADRCRRAFVLARRVQGAYAGRQDRARARTGRLLGTVEQPLDRDFGEEVRLASPGPEEDDDAAAFLGFDEDPPVRRETKRGRQPGGPRRRTCRSLRKLAEQVSTLPWPEGYDEERQPLRPRTGLTNRSFPRSVILDWVLPPHAPRRVLRGSASRYEKVRLPTACLRAPLPASTGAVRLVLNGRAGRVGSVLAPALAGARPPAGRRRRRRRGDGRLHTARTRSSANIEAALGAGVACVVGTSGWEASFERVDALGRDQGRPVPSSTLRTSRSAPF